MDLTEDQWNKFHSEFGDLIHYISRRISGDKMICSHEDNVSDLQLIALEATAYYLKKVSTTFDEAIGTKEYQSYIKTSLWNMKNKKGAKISRRKGKCTMFSLDYDITGEGSPNTGQWAVDTKSVSSIQSGEYLADQLLPDQVDPNVAKVLKVIVNDPSTVDGQGRLVITKVREASGLSIHFNDKAITSLENILRKDFNGKQTNQRRC